MPPTGMVNEILRAYLLVCVVPSKLAALIIDAAGKAPRFVGLWRR